MVYLQQEEVITLENSDSYTSPLASSTALSTNNPRRYMNQQLPPWRTRAVALPPAPPHRGEGVLNAAREGNLASDSRLFEVGKRHVMFWFCRCLSRVMLDPFGEPLVRSGQKGTAHACPKSSCPSRRPSVTLQQTTNGERKILVGERNGAPCKALGPAVWAARLSDTPPLQPGKPGSLLGKNWQGGGHR